MGLLNRNTPTAVEIDAQTADRLEEIVSEESQPVLGIRPYRGEDTIERGERLLSALHDIRRGGLLDRKNVTPAQSFELCYTDTRELLQFRFIPGESEDKRRLLRQLNTYYPDSDVAEREPTFLNVEAGDYVAGAHLQLRDSNYYKPLKNYKIDPDHFKQDPYDSITSEMVGAPERPDADVIVQFILRPAFSTESRDSKNWFSGIPDTLEELKKPTAKFSMGGFAEELGNIVAQNDERADFTRDLEDNSNNKAASVVAQQYGKKGYHLNIRVLAVSSDPDEAVSRVQETAGMYRKFYNSQYEQGFKPNYYSARKLPKLLERAAAREWTDRDMVFATDSVAGVCHVPTDIHTQAADYTLTTAGNGVPPGTPRFDFEEYGLSDTSPEKEKQIAMMDAADVGEPYWYGWGKRKGIEAGVYDRYLNAHQGVFGRTRMGKTVALTNFAGQAMRRYNDEPGADSEGGIIVDPKGQDGDEFIAEWPEDRDEDDLIVVDLDDKHECIPRFNMLEIPSNIEPGTRAFDSYTNAVADVATMMVAEAGGSDNYVGSVMKRVTRTLARGMLKSDRTCTFLDLAACASYKGNFEQFSEWMGDDRLAFIAQAAQRMAEDDNIDLNPLAGRFDEYVQPDSIRSMISAREPTFSVQEAVDEGKWIVLIFPEYAGETEVTALTNAYMAETYLAKLLSDNEAPYHFIGDEVHNFTTSESMLPHILSQGGGLGYRCTLACQSPANQLKDAPAVRDAIQDNVDIWLTFKMPGNSSKYAASQFREVDADDLENVTRHSAYLVQYTDDDEDIGTMIDTLPPIREVREEILGDAARSDEEIGNLKRRSMEQYGEPLESAEEQAAKSHFYSEGNSLQGDGTQAAACKAVYDAALRSGDDLSVPLEECEDAIRDALAVDPDDDRIDTRERLWRNVIQPIPDSMLTESDRDGELWLTVGDDTVSRVKDVGDDESSGGALHSLVLQDAYPAFNDLGVSVGIAEQGEGKKSLPDGTIDPTPLLEVDDDADPVAIAEALEEFRKQYPTVDELTGGREAVLEAEKSTGDTKQGQTVRNLASAFAESKKCLFVCREDVADNVWRTLAEEPRGARERHSVDGETRFYNLRPLAIDGERVYRDGAREDVWIRDESTGEIVLRDGAGEEHARFPDAASVFEDVDRYPAVGDEAGDDLRTIKTPIIPEYEFDGEAPEPGEDWFVVVVPEASEDETLSVSDLEVYVDGMTVPIESLGTDVQDETDDEPEPEPEDDDGGRLFKRF